MKKFLAILLACVMTLALAVPAMADTQTVVNEVWFTIDEPIPGNSASEAESSLSISAVYGGTGRQSLGADALYLFYVDDWLVKEGTEWVSFTGETFEAGKSYRANVNVYVDDEDYIFNSNSVKVYFNGGEEIQIVPEQENAMLETNTQVFPMAVTQVDITASTPKAGDKISDYAVTVTSTSGDVFDSSIKYWWYSKTTGSSEDYQLITDDDAVFEAGMDYKCNPNMTTNEGYSISREYTVVTANGVEDPYAVKLNMETGEFMCSPTVEFSVTEAQDQSADGITITGATKTAATTATSTATKTGDSSNAMTYVITLIALVACAGVTLFATKKSR